MNFVPSLDQPMLTALGIFCGGNKMSRLLPSRKTKTKKKERVSRVLPSRVLC